MSEVTPSRIIVAVVKNVFHKLGVELAWGSECKFFRGITVLQSVLALL